jgi:hypothetical protein
LHICFSQKQRGEIREQRPVANINMLSEHISANRESTEREAREGRGKRE